MKKVFSLILALFIVCTAFTAMADNVRINEGSNPNVRSKPSTDGKILGNAKSNHVYELLSTSGNWYKIRLENGTEGWIANGMATIIKSNKSTNSTTKSTTSSTSSTSNSTNTIILFRNHKWYEKKTDFEQALFGEGAKSAGWLSSSNNIYRMSATDYANVTMGSDRVDGGGYRGWYSGIDVAGYTPSDIYACFIYPIKNGTIIHDEEQAEFYFGWYSFDSNDFADHQGIYNDLSQKLSKLYGKGKTNVGKYNTTTTWQDKEGNQIRLFINNDKDYVTLGYMAHDADKKLDAMKTALTKEAKAIEETNRNNNKNNNNGL